MKKVWLSLSISWKACTVNSRLQNLKRILATTTKSAGLWQMLTFGIEIQCNANDSIYKLLCVGLNQGCHNDVLLHTILLKESMKFHSELIAQMCIGSNFSIFFLSHFNAPVVLFIWDNFVSRASFLYSWFIRRIWSLT